MVARFADRTNRTAARLLQSVISGGKPGMERSAELQIRSILEMADQMIAISEHGFVTCDDDGCLLLNGMVRECAYRLRDAAERERRAHGTAGNRHGGKAGRTVGEKRTK
jgi:hypothetical protein